MGRFFGKNELILAMLLVLLFDVNGFCDSMLNQMVYTDKSSLLMYVLAICFLLFDLFIYHSIVNLDVFPDVAYANNMNRTEHTCDHKINLKVHKSLKYIEELKKTCDLPTVTPGQAVSEQIVMNSIAVLLILLIISGMLVKNGDGVHSRLWRFIYGAPCIIISGLILGYFNIYYNVTKT